MASVLEAERRALSRKQCKRVTKHPLLLRKTFQNNLMEKFAGDFLQYLGLVYFCSPALMTRLIHNLIPRFPTHGKTSNDAGAIMLARMFARRPMIARGWTRPQQRTPANNPHPWSIRSSPITF
jgi:hypothetical protein